MKYSVDERFFDSWGSKMAYVLGFLYADGSMEDASYLRGKYVRVSSTDEEIILKIKKWLQSQHTVVPQFPKFKNHKMKFLLRIGNKRLYSSLLGKGLFPAKSLSMKFPRVPKRYLRDFVRGYFDGDGCVHIEKVPSTNGGLRVKRLGVIFTSGSKSFLEELSQLLTALLSIKQKKVYTSLRSFQLRYSSRDSIALFRFCYRNCEHGLYLERKYQIFLNYFDR